MIKYALTAAALKLFSISPQTIQMYRRLGNVLDQRRRIHEGLNGYYIERAKKILALCEKNHAIQEGDRLLEVGTGWVHWESMILRLFYDVEITMFDVWDNRYFGAFKKYFGQLEKIIDDEIDMKPGQCKRVHELLRVLLQARSFDEIYTLLGLQYVISPGGRLEQFQDETFALIYSCDVLEHIHLDILPEFIHDFHRLLKPEGYSIHKIDPSDHLTYYDTSASVKNYLRYSPEIWKRYFENDVQYINRVQRSEWLDLLQSAGLDLVEEETIAGDIETIKIDKSYAKLSKQDRQCIMLTVVHQKPLQSLLVAKKGSNKLEERGILWHQ